MLRTLKRLYGNWKTLDRMDRWVFDMERHIGVLNREFAQLEQAVNLYENKISDDENVAARLRALEAQHNLMHAELLNYREMAAFGDLPGQKNKDAA